MQSCLILPHHSHQFQTLILDSTKERSLHDSSLALMFAASSPNLRRLVITPPLLEELFSLSVGSYSTLSSLKLLADRVTHLEFPKDGYLSTATAIIASFRKVHHLQVSLMESDDQEPEDEEEEFKEFFPVLRRLGAQLRHLALTLRTDLAIAPLWSKFDPVHFPSLTSITLKPSNWMSSQVWKVITPFAPQLTNLVLEFDQFSPPSSPPPSTTSLPIPFPKLLHLCISGKEDNKIKWIVLQDLAPFDFASVRSLEFNTWRRYQIAAQVERLPKLEGVVVSRWRKDGCEGTASTT